MMPRFKPYFNSKEFWAALGFSRGSIDRFEKAFAEKFECNYGTMFPYGRSGLYSILKSCRLKDSEIICPAYTCVVVPNAIVLSGNIPVFVDCEKGSFNMSCDSIDRSITGKTRAIIVTHLFGYPMDVHRIGQAVKNAEQKYGNKIYIIQDVGHSFGTRWAGRLVTGFGDAAIFSLGISKIINSISGGMVTTNDKEMYDGIKKYRDENFVRQGPVSDFKKLLFLLGAYPAFNKYTYGLVYKLEKKGLLDKIVKYYDEKRIYFPKDWDYYPGEMEARVGSVQLRKYDEIEKKKRAIAEFYNDNLKDLNDIVLPPLVEGATYSHYVCSTHQRDRLTEYMKRKGIQLGCIIEYSIPHMNAYEKYRGRNCENSLFYSKTVINLPNYPGLSEKDMQFIAEKLREYR